MSTMNSNGLRLRYELEGREDAPVLALSNSLGTDLGMWGPQMPALLERFRVLRYDTRGHGESEVTPGPYSIAQLGADVIALLDHLQIARAHFCGLSMGGMIGMWLGTHHGARIERLVLCNTAAKIGSPEVWNTRIDTVNAQGMAAIVPGVIDRWFTADFQQRAPGQIEVVRAMLLRTSPQGYTANCAAVRDMDQREEIAAINVPTLVIGGSHDLATPPQDSRQAAERIAGARYVELDAAHLSNWERPVEFTRELIGFLSA
jgi:3-oxoadipate enol-lactonase